MLICEALLAPRAEQPESYPYAVDGIITYERKREDTQDPFPAFPGVLMPGKSIPGKVKTRKTNDFAIDLWVAPRRTQQKPPRIYEPVSGSRLNRYLEFADIALGVKAPGVRRKKAVKTGGSPGSEKPEPKTVSINHNRRGFGAFRNSR